MTLLPRPRRYPLIAPVELTDLRSEARMEQVISDLSPFGCHVSTRQMWPIGTSTRIRIGLGDATFEAQAKIVYGRPMQGMGVVFTSVEPDHQVLLDKWLADLKSSMQK
jgi:hypothetical protein